MPSLDRIISSNITAVAFGVFTDETSGFSVRIVLFTVFNQSTVEGLVISQFLGTTRITGAHGFRRMIGVLSRGPFLESPGNLTGPESYF